MIGGSLITITLSTVGIYVVYLLLYLSRIYNDFEVNHMFGNSASNASSWEWHNHKEPLEYDYIIGKSSIIIRNITVAILNPCAHSYLSVGGGTAGALIASKLIDYRVLLIEAGAGSLNFIPALPVIGPLLQESSFDWNYITEPQKHACKALKERRSKWPRGKVFGGSFLISNLIHMRGDPKRDYEPYVASHMKDDEDFEREIGQYFKEYEDLMEINDNKASFSTEFSKLLKVAGSEIGFDVFDHPKVSTHNGFRFTTANLYRTKSASANHTLMFNAMATKMLLTADNTIVEGVQFVRGDAKYAAKARHGVILSAGTIGSAQLLLRSGIGPKDDLEELGLECKSDLPVGRHLIDHVATGFDLVVLNESLGTNFLDVISPQNILDFLSRRQGLISSTGCDLVGILNVTTEGVKDLQYMVIPVSLDSDNGAHFKQIINIRDDIYWSYFHKPENQHQRVSILTVLLQPKSEGFIKLRSLDPTDKPIIDPQYLSHSDDKQVLYRGIRIIQELLRAPSLTPFQPQFNRMPFPGCTHLDYDTEPYWMCYIEHLTLTSYHPAGTCRMGADRRSSVVGLDFKVHGLTNLYVVDASVMPKLPSANPIATINMLALRFVDRMKAKLRSGKS